MSGTRSARALAHEALVRIEEGSYANLIVPALLEGSGLDARDRSFATELAYGTTRMQRACDWLVAGHVSRPYDKLDPSVRAALRLGAYQLQYLRVPAHAAVSATVGLAPKSARGLVNAVLRKVAAEPEPQWPDEATRLSYPDWVVERLTADLGEEAAAAALEQMNQPAAATERADGYVQDEASQLVAAYVSALPGTRTADLCAAPGGKATAIAGGSPEGFVVASDVRDHRARTVLDNVRRLGTGNVAVVQADGRRPPFRHGTFDRVLVDAPCSGLGVLRRRPDARWRVQPSDVDDLVGLQQELLRGALLLLRPGGALVYSVCTLTAAETVGIDGWLAQEFPHLTAVDAPGDPWRPLGRGARLLPQAKGTDGMYILGLRTPERSDEARVG